jgi:transposase
MTAYFGLVPSVYQSAGRQLNGHITKRGSPHIRRMLVEVAHAIARTRANSKLKKFFLRVRKRRGAKIALVALARKVLCILHHLLVNRETYHGEESGNPKRMKKTDTSVPTAMSIEEIIQIINKAGYEVRKKSCSFEG